MNTVRKVLLLLSCALLQVESAKILFITCAPAPSHQKPFQAIWKALADRGHEVHVLTPNPLQNETLKNLHEYDLSSFYELVKNANKDGYKYLTSKPSFFGAFAKDIYATSVWNGLYKLALQHNETRRLLESNKHFDVAIIEWIFPTMGSIAAYYKVPFIGITSLSAPTVSLDTLGNPSHPLIAPDMNLPLTRDMTLKERLLSGLYSVYVRLYYHFFTLPREDFSVKQFVSKDLPYLGDIEKTVSMLLLNRNPVLHRPIPLNSAILELGGIKLPASNQTLDPELKGFLDKSKNGVVYFSLGSTIKGVYLDDESIRIFQSVFRNLPYDVVWKWENDTMEGKPKNVYVSSWVPQIPVLEHPNVKLFITQGGLQSTEEAIASHKPIIGIPFHSDQTSNVDTCVKYGMGKMLDLDDITAEKLHSDIIEIIRNPEYVKNAKKLDELMKDQPQDGLEKAIWWIEYVIRHKGAKHLRSMAVDLPWWKYLMLDIFGLILAVLLTALFIAYYIIKVTLTLVSRWLRPGSKKNKRKFE